MADGPPPQFLAGRRIESLDDVVLGRRKTARRCLSLAAANRVAARKGGRPHGHRTCDRGVPTSPCPMIAPERQNRRFECCCRGRSKPNSVRRLQKLQRLRVQKLQPSKQQVLSSE